MTLTSLPTPSDPTPTSAPSASPTYAESRRVAEAGRETDWKLPSFGKELFLGTFRLDLIHPQPVPDPEAEAEGAEFLARVRAFLIEHVDPLQIERDAKIPDEVIEGMRQLGAFGVKIDKAYGGLGLSQLTYSRMLSLVGTYNAALAVLVSAHQSIGLPEPLRGFGTEEQKRAWLPRMARGEISAFLLTEPDVGSDPARMSSSAVPLPDGSGYVLNGQKLWATNGTVATVVVVMAKVPKSEGHRGGITAFIVPTDLPGVRVVARNDFMGLRGLENSLTEFENVHVPTDAVIGAEGLGLKIALTTLNTGRLAVPTMCAGASRYALKIAREFAVTRNQWGKPVGKHDAVAQRLALMAGSVFALEAIVDVATKLADDHRNDIRIEAALAKLFSTELGWVVMDNMVQIRGGRAYETAESLLRRGEAPIPAEQLLRDMRINRIFEGSTEIMHLLIAREAVDQHLQVAGDLLTTRKPAELARAGAKAGKFYAGWFPQLATGDGQNPRAYSEFGELATHLRFVERGARKLARSTFYLMGRYQGRLEQKGALLARVVDIGAELFAMSCSVVRADTIGRVERPEHAEDAAQLADLFCRQSRRRVDELFHELWHNDDDMAYGVAMDVLAGRHLWFEEGILDPADPHGEVPNHMTD
ncbi:MAG: acyl-CoA dehydrogenase family protein [Candidatus Phosphoribacter sp.]